MLPQLLCALFVLDWCIREGEGCGRTLWIVFFHGLLYPLLVPIYSIIVAVKILLYGEEKYDNLNETKGFKMFELLGQYFLFII